MLWSRRRVVTIGDRLGRDAAYFPRHSGIWIYSRPSEAAGKLAEAPHTLPGPGGAVTPTGNDADFSGLTVVGGHSAMATLLDDRLRFAMAIACLSLHAKLETSNLFLESMVVFESWRAGAS